MKTKQINDNQIWNVYAAISDNVGNHGSFLKKFAYAYIAADNENKELLKSVAVELIKKYNLDEDKYLNY